MVLAVALTPLTALTGTAQAATSWEQVGVPSGAPCPDVLVIGARGSGEAPQANGGIDPADYASDTFDGMGINNYTVYTQLRDKFPQLHIAHEGRDTAKS
jgi:hypothetical protein